jgi:hypothetical protein
MKARVEQVRAFTGERGLRLSRSGRGLTMSLGGVIVCLTLILSLIACGQGSSSGRSGEGSGGSGSGSGPPPSYRGNRTVLIRTGDTPSSAVYDSLHNLVFASEPDLGLVDAISIPGGQIVTRIPVPGVEAVGISADNMTILASTNLQQVAWIDTSLMRVTKWQMLPQVSDPVSGLQFWTPYNPYTVLSNVAATEIPTYAQNPYLLANGKVLFEALEGGYWSLVVEWDPVANTAVLRKDLPTGGFVVANTTGTEVLFASQPSFYDSATDSVRNSSAVGPALLAACNPAGTQYALFEGPSLVFIDTQFNIVGQVPLIVTGPLAQQPTGLVYSADGTHLYMVTPGPVAIITTIDTTTFSIVGTAPGYSNASPYSTLAIENPLAADSTGLVIGAAIGGLVFDDSTDFYTFTQNDEATAGFITPSEGAVQGGTATTVSTGIPGTPDVWFGSQLAITENANGLTQVQASTPAASAAGVVDVKIIESTGVMVTIPQGFTYGSVPLLTAPLASAPSGGVVADIYGFGFSADSGATTQQVTIGTGSAKVVAATQLQGFPVQDLTLNVPPGSPGAADIVVKSATGSAAYPKGFRYLSSVTDYASSDTFLAVLYDPTRQQLYLNAGSHIDVFSLVNRAFGTPITPPSLGGTRQLQGMALTPDGSLLIVGNFSDDSVSIINPDDPATATAVQIAPPSGPDSLPEGPHAVATTSNGNVFVDIGTTNELSGGGGAIYELDLTTLQATQRNDIPGVVQVSGEPMSQSGDGTEVFLAVPGDSGGYVMAWFAATDSWQAHNLGGEAELFYSDVAAASDGNVFAINNDPDYSGFPFPMFVNPQLNQISQLGIESLFAAVNQPGMALHDSGALLYSSTDLGVDIIDVPHGALAERILLNEQDAFLSGSLAVDETGQSIFLVTNAGLTIIELDAVPLSIGSLTPTSGGSGTVIQVRGSGFQAGTTATLNGTAAATRFLDGDTLQITIPSIGSGPVAVTLSNPDGTSYELDGAFSVQ